MTEILSSSSSSSSSSSYSTLTHSDNDLVSTFTLEGGGRRRRRRRSTRPRVSKENVQKLRENQQEKEIEKEKEREESVVALIVETLRKSLVTCTSEDISCPPMEISWPSDVRHVVHVTFDRFHGFLGLPVEFELEVPRRVPSASVSVFGVSAESMQCSFDSRGNSVPTILLHMQKRLYSIGGLKAEGIFRINGENSQEEYVRNQLNKGIVPHDIDPHCLAGLIKAWFRELPRGVLDTLTPEQVIQCNTEEDCIELINGLPSTQAALLDWAINLMADVVQEEKCNKMNARNIAMVFAPNMTQMADPLTALMYAVQVMNFLKTLILKTIREREAAASVSLLASSCRDHRDENNQDRRSVLNRENRTNIDENETACESLESLLDAYSHSVSNDSATEDCFLSFNEKDTGDDDCSSSVDKKDNSNSSGSLGYEAKEISEIEVSNESEFPSNKKSPKVCSLENGHVRTATSEESFLSYDTIVAGLFRSKTTDPTKKVGKHCNQSMLQVTPTSNKMKEQFVTDHIRHQFERAESWHKMG